MSNKILPPVLRLSRINHVYKRPSSSSPIHTNQEPLEAGKSLKSDVIALYKNLIYLSREWPTDLKPQIKRAFMKNKDVTDESEIRQLIARGEYICREITATYHLRKYRAMKRRYYLEHENQQFQDMFKGFSS